MNAPQPWTPGASGAGGAAAVVPLLDAAGRKFGEVYGDTPQEAMERAGGVCAAVNAMPSVQRLAAALVELSLAVNAAPLTTEVAAALAQVTQRCVALGRVLKSGLGLVDGGPR